jgi:beta-lactam-binding protein with PASTA domain
VTIAAGAYFASEELGTKATPTVAPAPTPAVPAPPVKTAVDVPDLRGLDVDQARKVAGRHGSLELEVLDRYACDYDDDRDMLLEGQVCDQKPVAGTSVVEGSTIKVVVERDTYEHGGVGTTNEWRRMPDLVGMPVDEAHAELARLGFDDGELSVEHDTACPARVVCGSQPEPGHRKVRARAGRLYVGP